MPIAPGTGVMTRFQPGENHAHWKGKKRLVKSGHAGTLLRVTEEQYETLLALQNGLCAICQRPPKKNRLHVDHDHKSGKIRGLLCFRCNYGLAWFQEDAVRFKQAAAYLSRAD